MDTATVSGRDEHMKWCVASKVKRFARMTGYEMAVTRDHARVQCGNLKELAKHGIGCPFLPDCKPVELDAPDPPDPSEKIRMKGAVFGCENLIPGLENVDFSKPVFRTGRLECPECGTRWTSHGIKPEPGAEAAGKAAKAILKNAGFKGISHSPGPDEDDRCCPSCGLPGVGRHGSR